MTVDSSLEFERKRNIPVRYDRELVSKTITAIEKVEEIKAKRERAFMKERRRQAKLRMKASEEEAKEELKKEVEEGMSLLQGTKLLLKKSLKQKQKKLISASNDVVSMEIE